jgi:hypothetical protein
MIGSVPGAAPALAAGERTIAVVVDFGSGQGLPQSFSLCVREPAGATDAQALADALASRGLATPTYSSAGLLCTIAGFPATGCGARAPGGYSYWAYFHGGGRWGYATDGPAERQADPGVAQGWRFEPNGHGNPSDPAPDGPSDVASICPAASTPTTGPTTGGVTTTTAPSSVAGEATTTVITTTTSTTTRGSVVASTVPGTPTSSTSRVATPASARAAAGSSAGTFLAVVVLVLLAGAGGLLVWRRRS